MTQFVTGNGAKVASRVARWVSFGAMMTIGLGGCCGLLGGRDGNRYHCLAAIEWRGERASAAGIHGKADKAKSRAREGMCKFHCEAYDPDVTKALETYRKTPKGEQSRAGRSFDIGHDSTAKKHHKRCVADCAAAVQAGKAKTKFECRAKARKSCTAELDYEGKTHTGASPSIKSELEAWRLACRSYCKADDPAVAKAYERWIDSPQGKKYETPRDEALESERPSDELGTCQGRCIADIIFGKASVGVTCK